MELRITQYGEPVLREKGRPVTEFGPELKQLAEDMVETMRAADGIGLAAQQIGRALQFCVVDVHFPDSPPEYFYELDGRKIPFDMFMPLALANPQVEVVPLSQSDYDEGCLSFPEITGIVNRPDRIRVRYQDVDGHPHVLECEGILARCIQHEVDHLNGVLFIDHMDRRSLAKVEKKLKRLKRDTRDWLKAHS